MLTAFAMSLLSVLALLLALLVRLAGRSRVLRGVDYGRVRDPHALHAWAGNRLQPRMAYFLLAGLLLGFLSSAIALGTGALKFQA